MKPHAVQPSAEGSTVAQRIPVQPAPWSQPPPNPWAVSEADYPADGGPWQQLSYCLNYAILAPSSHNTQPWRFKIGLDEVSICADRTRALPTIDPQDRALVMSCGAALFHLRLALRYFGHRDDVALFPHPLDSELLARVRIGEPCSATPDEVAMFRAIPHRRTNRQPFEARPLSDALLELLRRAAVQQEADLVFANSEKRRRTLANFVWHGDRAQMTSPAFRRELAAWIHPAHAESRDGIPGYAHGLSELLDFATPAYSLALRTFDMGRGIAAHDVKLMEGSPALVILVTATDTPFAWLSAGQALARVLLLAAASGVSASFLNQPVEVEPLRSELRKSLALPGFPQTILRLGYGPDSKPTPRRDVRDVIA